jgi:hypothetical protein
MGITYRLELKHRSEITRVMIVQWPAAQMDAEKTVQARVGEYIGVPHEIEHKKL